MPHSIVELAILPVEEKIISPVLGQKSQETGQVLLYNNTINRYSTACQVTQTLSRSIIYSILYFAK